MIYESTPAINSSSACFS